MELLGMPMPPSVNALYRNVRRSPFSKGSGRVKTEAYKKYEMEMKIWASRNRDRLDFCARAIRSNIELARRSGMDQRLTLTTTFKFQRSEIYTKQGTIKRNDTSNRLKALHDVLADALGVDDCHFWSESYTKRVSHNTCVDVLIGLHAVEEE